MVIIPERGTITASSGSADATIQAKHYLLKQIFVKAATSSTTFDVKLTDVFNNIIFVRSDNTGELNELLDLPSYGNLTLTVFNSSADEIFTYLVAFRD